MKMKLFKEERVNPKAGTEGLHFVVTQDDTGDTVLHVFDSEDQAGLYHGQLRGYGGVKRIGRLKGSKSMSFGYINDGVAKQFGAEPRMIRHDQGETNPRSYRKNPRNSGDDPSRDEMIEHIRKVYGREADEFDIEEAIYWFATDYHGGQSSNLYSALSTSEYRPGRSSSGPEEGSMGEMIYSDLVDTFSPKKNPVRRRIGISLSKNRKRNPVYDTGSDE
jgi:hypothetical protein